MKIYQVQVFPNKNGDNYEMNQFLKEMDSNLIKEIQPMLPVYKNKFGDNDIMYPVMISYFKEVK